MNQQTSIWLPEAASTIAGDVDALFYFILVTSVIFFVGVVMTMVFFAWRYRRRSPDDRPEPVHENKLVEASWIVIPSVLVAVVFVWGFKLFLELGIAPPKLLRGECDCPEMELEFQLSEWGYLYRSSRPGKSSNQTSYEQRRCDSQFFCPSFSCKSRCVARTLLLRLV